MSDKPAIKSSTTNISASKPICDIHPTAVIADKAILSGTHTIKIGENSIVQPYAKLNAEGGPITIGSNCTVAEAATLEVPSAQSSGAGEIVLGDSVCIESSAQISASSIGEASEIGIQAVVGEGATLGKFCKLAPKQHVRAGEQLADFTVVYGANQRRVDASLVAHSALREARVKGQAMHAEALKTFIPDASSKWTSS